MERYVRGLWHSTSDGDDDDFGTRKLLAICLSGQINMGIPNPVNTIADNSNGNPVEGVANRDGLTSVVVDNIIIYS